MIKITLKDLMIKNDISVSELSRRTNIPRSTIILIRDNHTKRIDFNSINQFCNALNCEPSDLIKYVPDEKKPVYIIT